jgi:hypothetical protein
MILLLAALLSQAPTVTRVGTKVGQDVNCIQGCSGSGSGSAQAWVTIDGGYVGIWDGVDTADVTAAGALKTDSSATTQPVSNANLDAPLSGLLTSGTFTARHQHSRAEDDGRTARPSSSRQIRQRMPVGDGAGPLTVDGTVAVAALDVNLSTRLAEATFTGRFPAAGALADNTTNPTTTGIATYLMLFDGTTWDRAPGDSVNGLKVQGAVSATQSGTWSARLLDGAGNALASSTSAPGGTEQALIVRNIPSGTQPVSGTTTANQGTAAASSGAWPAKVTDGTNVAAVKAASTAPAAADPALVVAVSPNTPAVPTNLSQVAGNTVSQAATGIQKVGITGNQGAVFDAQSNAAAPANLLVVGGEAQSSALSSSATAANVRRLVLGLDGVSYVARAGRCSSPAA